MPINVQFIPITSAATNKDRMIYPVLVRFVLSIIKWGPMRKDQYKGTGAWLWGIKLHSGEYVRVWGNTVDDALRTLRKRPGQVKRYTPIKRRET